MVIPTLASSILSGMFMSASGETDDAGYYVLLFGVSFFTHSSAVHAAFQRRNVQPVAAMQIFIVTLLDS